MTCVCIIPARGGSQRIPRKNIRPFRGKPIIAYSIETAMASSVFDGVFVSTEDDEIAEVALQYGAGVIKRQPLLALNQVGTQEVVRDAVLQLKPQIYGLEFACCLYATAPLLKPETLQLAYMRLRHAKAPTYVVPIATWMRDPGQFYFGTASAFICETPLEEARLIKIDPATEIDINTEDDWKKAEEMYAAIYG